MLFSLAREREGAIFYSHLLDPLGLKLIGTFLYYRELYIYEV